MTLTTTPTTRPSSSTTTTSFDLQRPPSPSAMGTAAGVDGAFAVAQMLAFPAQYVR